MMIQITREVCLGADIHTTNQRELRLYDYVFENYGS